MSLPKAFLFDLNGTMVDDMAYHLDAWYQIVVNEFGANLSREQVKHHMYGKSQELLVRIFGEQKFTTEQLDSISLEKDRQYRQQYRPHLDLLPGLFSFLEQAYHSKIKMAIGSATTPFNIDFVIDNLKIRHYFEAIVSADHVAKSKPYPETYLKAAKILKVSPSDCIVFEDAPKGVEAALNAGMKAVVITTMHPKEDFQKYDNVLMYIENYLDLTPAAFSSEKVFSFGF